MMRRFGIAAALVVAFVVGAIAPAAAGYPVPDLKIRRSAAIDYVGTGTGEDCLYAPEAKNHVKVGQSAHFDIKVKNVGTGDGSIVIEQEAIHEVGSFQVRYYKGLNDITSAVKGSGRVLGTHKPKKIRLEVTPTAAPGGFALARICVQGAPGLDSVEAEVIVD